MGQGDLKNRPYLWKNPGYDPVTLVATQADHSSVFEAARRKRDTLL